MPAKRPGDLAGAEQAGAPPMALARARAGTEKHVYISSSSAELTLNGTWPKSQEVNCSFSHGKLCPNLSPAQRKCPHVN